MSKRSYDQKQKPPAWECHWSCLCNNGFLTDSKLLIKKISSIYTLIVMVRQVRTGFVFDSPSHNRAVVIFYFSNPVDILAKILTVNFMPKLMLMNTENMSLKSRCVWNLSRNNSNLLFTCQLSSFMNGLQHWTDCCWSCCKNCSCQKQRCYDCNLFLPSKRGKISNIKVARYSVHMCVSNWTLWEGGGHNIKEP